MVYAVCQLILETLEGGSGINPRLGHSGRAFKDGGLAWGWLGRLLLSCVSEGGGDSSSGVRGPSLQFFFCY